MRTPYMCGRVVSSSRRRALVSLLSITAAGDHIPVRHGFSPSVLPQRGGLKVVGVGLQHAGVVAAQVFPVGGVADGQLVVVAELKEEVDGRVAAAHHRLLVPHHPVFTCGVCRKSGEEAQGRRKSEE